MIEHQSEIEAYAYLSNLQYLSEAEQVQFEQLQEYLKSNEILFTPKDFFDLKRQVQQLEDNFNNIKKIFDKN